MGGAGSGQSYRPIALPRWLTDSNFRFAYTSGGESSNSECFKRELMDHYRLVFEKVGGFARHMNQPCRRDAKFALLVAAGHGVGLLEPFGERRVIAIDQFAAREVHVSSADSRRIHDAVGWEPPDGMVTFYVGKHQDQVAGALMFMRVDCQHGPLELAIGFDPSGKIRGVEVTKATVEMKPWVLEALRAGLTDAYRGLAPDLVCGDDFFGNHDQAVC